MDDSAIVDWYPVIEAVANGQREGHPCPLCGAGPLEVSQRGGRVRLRCPSCSEGVEGALGHGRDDAFYAEEIEAERRRNAPPVDPLSAVCAPHPGEALDGQPAVAAQGQALTDPGVRRTDPQRRSERRGDPFEWRLPPGDAHEPDLDALALWTPLVEAVHNGRRSGLRCPYCSEPLSDIVHDPPFMRLGCGQCGEAFEGRIG